MSALRQWADADKARRDAHPLSLESLKALKRALDNRYDGPDSPPWLAGLLAAVRYAVEMVEDEES